MNFSLPSLGRLTRTTISVSLSLMLLACATPKTESVVLNLVAINDLHGHLEKEKFSYTPRGEQIAKTVVGGGIETLGTNLEAWRKEDKDLIFVGGGDLIGASPAISSLFADEPTLHALGRMGLRVSALGNHEFDHGLQELQRQIHGGCESPRPERACQFDGRFPGTQFSYIASNVLSKQTQKPFFPAYHVEEVKGVKIAFIGAVLRDTPFMVAGDKVKDLSFIDEAEGINRTIPVLKEMGVKVFVVLIHEGVSSPDVFDQFSCSQIKGPIVDIVKRLDPAIKLIVSGHSHTGFVCNVEGRTVTQAQMYGHLLTRIAIKLDGATHQVVDIQAKNLVMEPSSAPAPEELSNLLHKAREGSKAIIAEPVAKLAVPVITRKLNAAGESALGNIVADAQLAAVKDMGAQIAFMNNKGIRSNLETLAGNISTYGQNATVFPFGNTLVLMSLSGAQIRRLLEQQVWLDEESQDGRNVLQVSDGFTYTWDAKRKVGERVIPESVKLNGVPLDDQREYRIVANNFIAGGGDRVPMFLQGKNVIDTGIKDIDVFMAYIKQQEKAGTPVGSEKPVGRVQRQN